MKDLAVEQIGQRLRDWRKRRNLTLEELSELSEISPSTISRLESGKRAPNLELVIPLARALRLELDDLVPRAVPDPRIRPTTRRVDGVTSVTLSPEASPNQVVRMTFPAKPVTAPQQRVHDGYDWVYVLSGRVRLLLGERDMVLETGEAAEFDTRTPHWLGAAGTRPAEVLAIFNKHGKRLHLHSPGVSEDTAGGDEPGAKDSSAADTGAAPHAH